MDIIISKRSFVAGLFGKGEYITYMSALIKSFFNNILVLAYWKKKEEGEKVNIPFAPKE